MDPIALEVLEFPAIASGSPRATATELGAALAPTLQPSPDPDEVARRQALTAEAIALLDESLEPPLEGIRDVREQAAHAALGGALSPQALRHVADTVAGALRARAALDEAAAPLLRELAAAIDPALAPLAKAIDRAVEEDGSDLRDNASPKLRKLAASCAPAASACATSSSSSSARASCASTCRRSSSPCAAAGRCSR